MELLFEKYQGAGNDFVMLNNLDGCYDSITVEQIALLCDRRFGIGADGLMLLTKSDVADAEFRMVYYNQDGSRASFCGNGARCICAFASSVTNGELMAKGNYCKFVADDAMHVARVSEGWVDLKMVDVDEVLQLAGGTFLNTGVPHFVRIEASKATLDNVDIMQVAPKIRYSEPFKPAGTNVNFISIINNNEIAVRTYERGVEGETLACGTGIVASAITASLTTNTNQFKVHARGGDLTVCFDAHGHSFHNVWLGGPAIKVFSGVINI
ncbi:MAG: diaminopimelate epimerase [Marinilabiliaceae bacterium]|nr:diaminopimelate epimerase [Marinilabiliaceae bacterium]